MRAKDIREAENENVHRKATTSLLISKQTLRRRQAERDSSNEQLIISLEQKNRRLKQEIVNVTELIRSKSAQSPKEGAPPARKLIPNEGSGTALRSELQNVYKSIKMYEREIRQLQSQQGVQVQASGEMGRLESLVKSKQALIQKSREELSRRAKEINDNSRRLKDNVAREQDETRIRQLNDQIKYLREKHRSLLLSQTRKQQNATKQQSYIRALEGKLLSLGLPQDQLQALQKGKPTPKTAPKPSQQPIPDRTLEQYKQIQNEIKVLSRLRVTNQKKGDGAAQEKKQCQLRCLKLKQILLQKERQIQGLEQAIRQARSRMTRLQMKPLFMEEGSAFGTRRSLQLISGRKKKPNAKPPASLRLDSAGPVLPQAIKFSDRDVLGKNYQALPAALGLYFTGQGSGVYLCGLQCFYQFRQKQIEGQKHLILPPSMGEAALRLQQVVLEPGQTFRSVAGCLLGAQGERGIKSLVFRTSKGRVLRAGETDPQARKFQLGGRDQDRLLSFSGALQDCVKEGAASRVVMLSAQFAEGQ